MATQTESFLRAAIAGETAEAFVPLVRINHPSLPGGALRFAHHPSDVISSAIDGTAESFHLSYFSLEPPAQGESGDSSVATIRIENVTREITTALNKISGGVTVDIAVVLASEPDTDQLGLPQFDLTRASWDALWVTCDLSTPDWFDQPALPLSYTPSVAPALF